MSEKVSLLKELRSTLRPEGYKHLAPDGAKPIRRFPDEGRRRNLNSGRHKQ